MLQHEQTDSSPVSPTVPLPIANAADARVTPDELNAALKALEDRQNSTVAIGSVVDELRLNATPEQIWAEVQQQRAQQQAIASRAEGQSAVTVNGKAANGKAALSPAAGRRRLRTWRDIKGWAWVLFWCTGGLGWATLSPLLHHHAVNTGQAATMSAGQTATTNADAEVGQEIHINSSLVTRTLDVQGKDVVINGDGDKITLHGKPRSLSVIGNGNTITADSADTAFIDGKADKVRWTGTPPPGSGLIDYPYR